MFPGGCSDDTMLGHACHDTFLDVEAIFRLLEDGVGMQFKNILADFLVAVGWETMEDNMLRGCFLEKGL